MNQGTVITILRSILMPSKTGMVIHELVKAFREQEDTKIPFAELGYDSFVDFLRKTGCFVVKPSNDGLMVSALNTAHSKHVIDLVKEQNVSSKKGRRKKRSKLQHPRTPLDIIYENDRAMRYGIQSIRKQIQPRRRRQTRAIVSPRVQCGPLSQIQNSIGSQYNSNRSMNGCARVQLRPLASLQNSKNNSNNRIDQVSVGPVNTVTVQKPVHQVQQQQSQPMAPVNDIIQNEKSLDTTSKSANVKLSKFSQALLKAMVSEPAELMQQSEPEPEPQAIPFDLAELNAYRSAVQAISVYCLKKGFSEPQYRFIDLNTKKILCSVIVNDARYGCYPHEYKTRDEAQMATAEIALLEIKKLEESMKYPVCKDSQHDIAQKIGACIGGNGVFLHSLQNVFQSAYHQRLPDNWLLIIQNNTDLFKLEANSFLGKEIIYPNNRNTQATGAIKKS